MHTTWNRPPWCVHATRSRPDAPVDRSKARPCAFLERNGLGHVFVRPNARTGLGVRGPPARRACQGEIVGVGGGPPSNEGGRVVWVQHEGTHSTPFMPLWCVHATRTQFVPRPLCSYRRTVACTQHAAMVFGPKHGFMVRTRNTKGVLPHNKRIGPPWGKGVLHPPS